MATSVSNFNPSESPAQARQGAAYCMMFLTGFSMVFHGSKLFQNSGFAGVELYLRRQQIAGKFLGPPNVNDPNFSDDSSSGSEDEAYIDPPEEGPSMKPLQLPKDDPKDDREFSGEEILMEQFPKEEIDTMPDRMASEIPLPLLLLILPGEP